MQPSAPPEYLMDSKTQKPPVVSLLSTRKPEFPSNRKNILESSEKGQSVSQSNFQISSAQNSQPGRICVPMYPKFLSDSALIPQYLQNNLNSNSTPENSSPVYFSANIKKEPEKSKKSFYPDCVIS